MKLSIPLVFFLLLQSYSSAFDIQIETPYAALINAETGKVLYEKNARTKIFPASTMKIATMLYTLENKGEVLDEMVTVVPFAISRTSEQEKKATNYAIPAHYLEPDGTMIYIRKNESLSIESLLFAAYLKSGNDACNALAFHLDGDMIPFLENLNSWIKKMGIESTNFMNPHGLHHPEHYSTAYDMAMIGRAAYHNKDFMQIALQREYEKPRTNLQKKEKWKSNSCILRVGDELSYSKVLFAKTGQMKAAKFNLVAAATNGERTLVAALHKSPNWKQRYLDVIQMFEAAFEEEKVKRKLFAKEDTSFEMTIPKANKILVAVPLEDVYLEYFASEEPNVQAKLNWDPDLVLPIKEGEKVGTIDLTSNSGQPLLSVDLYAKEKVSKKVIIRPRWAILGVCLFIYLGIKLFRSSRKKTKH